MVRTLCEGLDPARREGNLLGSNLLSESELLNSRLEIQQPALPVHPSAVAPEASVRLDDAVARDHDGHVVVAVGTPHSATPTRLPQVCRELAVAGRSPIGDFQQGRPNPPLPGCSTQVEDQVELSACPVKVLRKLGLQPIQMSMGRGEVAPGCSVSGWGDLYAVAFPELGGDLLFASSIRKLAKADSI